MNMSPIKKIVIALAAVTVAIALITANNMASVMLLVASREANAAQQVQNATVQTPAGNTGSTSGGSTSQDSNTVTPSTDTGSTGNTATDNTATGSTGSTGNTSTNNNTQADKPATDSGSSAGDKATSGKPESKAEIVAYFNKAVNSVKTDAKTVNQKNVTNYLAGTATISSGISGIYNMLGGDEWLDGMLQDNSQGEASYTGADIVAKFPVEGESWSSKLTEADVSSATCTEKAGVYTITITTIADAKSDSVKRGEGHAPKAFNVVLPGVVNDNIPGVAASLVGTASMDYPESTVVITVDAATGHVLTADYDLKWTINFDKMGIILPFGTKSSYSIVW